MKLSQSLLDLAVLSLASTVCAAPATPATDALASPETIPHLQIDLSVVPSHLAARDIDSADPTVDHPLDSHNFFGNEEWAIAVRPGVGPIWIHQSRWKTLEDEVTVPDAESTTDTDSTGNTTTIHPRQWYNSGTGYGYGSYYPYYGYGYGYGYYAKRDLEKRDTCPAQVGISGGCNAATGLVNEASMYPYNGVARAGWAPKMNVYFDTGCNTYMTSVIGSASCVISQYQIHGIITFNQQL